MSDVYQATFDAYQATFDAVRSRIGGCDTHDAISTALREAFGNADHQIRCSLQEVTGYLTEPSVMYRPALFLDGNQWCALYGEDLQNGVSGFGDSPAKAMMDFNKNWYAAINAKGSL